MILPEARIEGAAEEGRYTGGHRGMNRERCFCRIRIHFNLAILHIGGNGKIEHILSRGDYHRHESGIQLNNPHPRMASTNGLYPFL